MTEHEQAIMARLNEYELTLLTGINCFGKCEICHSVNVVIQDCKNCLLGSMSEYSNACIINGYSDWRYDFSRFEDQPLSKTSLNRIKIRLKVLNKHLISKGY